MNEKNQTILIQITEDETIATSIPTGWPGDNMTRAHAMRHPDDAFDAYIAARVALDRLFGKENEQVFEEAVAELDTPCWKEGDWVVATGSPICKEYWGKVGQVVRVEPFIDHCEYEAEFLDAKGRRIPQYWRSGGLNQGVRAATATEIQNAEGAVKERFQVGDIVRIVHPVPPTFDEYEKGDVAVVTKVDQPALFSDDRFYSIRIRSKERKGNEACVLGIEMRLLHRDGKKGGAKG